MRKVAVLPPFVVSNIRHLPVGKEAVLSPFVVSKTHHLSMRKVSVLPPFVLSTIGHVKSWVEWSANVDHYVKS